MILTLKEAKIKLEDQSFLSDTRTAFRTKSSKDLRKELMLFNMISMPSLIRIGSWLLNKALSMRLPVKGIVKRTLFRHFCGGETITEALKSMDRLSEQNVYAVLDYAAEGVDEENDFDHVASVIKENIRLAASNKNIRFISLKPSGLTGIELLEKKASNKALSPEEERAFELFRLRMNSICTLAESMKVSIYIDAEESWLQAPVDELAVEMMRAHNKHEALIFNTYQMYRRDRLPLIKDTLDRAAKEGFIAAIKIVRGAYMEKESKRALDLSYANPVFDKKEDTDSNFNEAIYLVLSHDARSVLCVATHNETSTQLALELQKQFRRDISDLQFSQLYGMSDHLTYNLAAKGYTSSKYLPYGQVEIAIPYLLRRARENSSVGKQSNRDRQLILQELERRKLDKFFAVRKS